jgi:hypothetical protein
MATARFAKGLIGSVTPITSAALPSTASRINVRLAANSRSTASPTGDSSTHSSFQEPGVADQHAHSGNIRPKAVTGDVLEVINLAIRAEVATLGLFENPLVAGAAARLSVMFSVAGMISVIAVDATPRS